MSTQQTETAKETPQIDAVLTFLKQPSSRLVFGTKVTTAELDRAFRAALADDGAKRERPNIDREMVNIVLRGRQTVDRMAFEISELQAKRDQLRRLLTP